MNILTDFHKAFRERLTGYPEHKFSRLIKDLKKSLKNPSIPADTKREIAERIAILEHNGSEHRSKQNLQMLAYSIYELGIGYLLGPVGSGIGTLTVSHRRSMTETGRKKQLRKAKIIGGRRVFRKNRKSRSQTRKGIDSTSILDGTSSYLQAVGWVIAAASIPSISGRLWNNLTF